MKFQAFLDSRKYAYMKKKKQLKRKAFLLKARLFLTFVLPVVIVLLAVKTIQTFIRIKLRKTASSVLDRDSHKQEKPVIKSVSQTFSKPDFITPVPAEKGKA